jgi:transcriptional regulator with XRE-family HTH domain
MRGSELRTRREAKGLSVAEVSEATGIPVEHVEALEEDRHADLPPGPYASAYERTLGKYLGLSTTPPAGAPAEGSERRSAPLWVVRALALASMVALFALLALSARERLQGMTGRRAGGSQAIDQHLEVVAKATTRLVVRADGAPVLDRTVAGGEELVFDARDSLEIEVPRVSDVSLRWNGEILVPQGRQDSPRLIVLVDDEDGG